MKGFNSVFEQFPRLKVFQNTKTRFHFHVAFPDLPLSLQPPAPPGESQSAPWFLQRFLDLQLEDTGKAAGTRSVSLLMVR